MSGYYPKKYGRHGGISSNPFGPLGATDRLPLNAASGSLTSLDLLKIYAANGSGVEYNVSGPDALGFLGIKCNADTEFYQRTIWAKKLAYTSSTTNGHFINHTAG